MGVVWQWVCPGVEQALQHASSGLLIFAAEHASLGHVHYGSMSHTEVVWAVRALCQFIIMSCWRSILVCYFGHGLLRSQSAG